MREEPVHYMHRTAFVPSLPARHHHYHQSREIQNSVTMGQEGDGRIDLTSPVKRTKRKIVIKSLVADSLDAIAETSENSEEVSSIIKETRGSTLKNETTYQENAQVQEVLKPAPSSMASSLASSDDDHSINLEEEHTTDTEKSTKSGNNSDGGDTRQSSNYDGGDGDDDDDSIGDKQSRKTSLANYLKPQPNYSTNMNISNMNMNLSNIDMNMSSSELASLDGDNSAMMFSYDVEENDDDDVASGKLSLGASRHDDEDDLSWRLDPSISMSDWTVTVVSRSSKIVEHYYVHKNMLAVGKRKSEYFVDTFRQHYKSGSKSNVTEIIVPDQAAQLMPMLLDYIYLDVAALSLSSETASSLRYLSQFFGIKVLFERVMKFIQKDLSLKSLVSYYKSSVALADRKILGITARHCARNIHLVDAAHPLLETIDPEFFHKVLSNPLLAPDKSAHISLLVAKYCQMHKDRLKGTLFVNLTNPEFLPKIHHSAALTLLSMEADLVVATSLMSYMTLSSLQERCVNGLASNWRELTETDPMRTAQVCRKLPSIVVTELLLKSLDRAKTDNNRQSTTRVLVRKGGSKVKPGEESLMKKEYQESIDRLKAEFDTKTSHLQELCYEKDKHIKVYYEELARYQRLPNNPDGKLVASGRSVQPSKMPELGKHNVEGYVLAGKKKDSSKYPIFYYKTD